VAGDGADDRLRAGHLAISALESSSACDRGALDRLGRGQHGQFQTEKLGDLAPGPPPAAGRAGRRAGPSGTVASTWVRPRGPIPREHQLLPGLVDVAAKGPNTAR
jgi:hypothetical protein